MIIQRPLYLQKLISRRHNKSLRDPDALLDYIDSKLTDEAVHYIMIYEIQHVSEFEDVLNSYLNMPNADVYVTGSNARFLSKDVITTFRGRGDEIKLYPLSFGEVFPYMDLQKDRALTTYMLFGGLPQVVQKSSEEEKNEYLKRAFCPYIYQGYKGSVRYIDDSFRKIIIVSEDTPVLRNEARITTIGIYDFLLNENSLDL